MIGKIATVLITLSWLAMMALLAHREILPEFRAARELSVSAKFEQLEKLAAKYRSTQMGIYVGNRRVGVTRSSLTLNGPLLQLKSDTEMRLSDLLPQGLGYLLPGLGLGANMDVKVHFECQAEEGQLSDLRLTVIAPPADAPLIIMDGEPGLKNNLILRINEGGTTHTEEVPLDPRQLLSLESAPGFMMENLKVGDRWKIRSLDMSMGVSEKWARVVREERIVMADGEHNALLVLIGEGSGVKVWVAPDGEVLRQTAYNITFERETPPPATAPATKEAP